MKPGFQILTDWGVVAVSASVTAYLQLFPLFNAYLALDYCFNLSHQHFDLRHRILGVGGKRLPVLAECQELVAGAGI